MFLFSVHPLTEETLRGFRPSKGFLGAAGLTLGEGMSSTNLPHSQIKQIMARISDKVILLTVHTKFGHVSYSIVAPINVLDRVVTDSGIRAATGRYWRREAWRSLLPIPSQRELPQGGIRHI